MFTHISETATKFTAVVSDKLKLTDNYNHISNKFDDNYKRLSEYYPFITESLTSTRSTFNNGTEYIYSIPSSVGDKVYSYATILQPVSGEFTKVNPNDCLDENCIPLNEERQELANHVLDIYNNKISKESFKYYADEVVYEDQFMYSEGLPDLKAQFYGYNLLQSPITSYKILENTLTVLKISLNQTYYFPAISKYGINLNSIIVLNFDDEGQKVIKHTVLFCGFQPIYHAEILRKGAAKLRSNFVKVPELK